MKEYLFSKAVDQSLLKSGLTVPKEACEKMQVSLGVVLEKGQYRNISIKIDDKTFEAKFVNVNFAETITDRTVFQIRYSSQSEICLYLNSKYPQISEFIANHNSDEKLIIPSDIQESIDVYAIDGEMLEFKDKRSGSAVLEAFYKYLGPVNSLGGYERSYKLVLYKVLFESIRDGLPTSTDKIAELFRDYYIERIQQGKVPDINVSRAIADPVNSSVKDTLDVILKNPYNVIHQKGFMSIENDQGKEYFKLSSELNDVIDDHEIDKILDIVEQKLKLYYSSIDIGDGGKLREVIDKFINGYVDAKKGSFSGSPFGTFVRSEIPNAIYNTGIVDTQKYLITGSVGQGNWATIPWICIFDRSITTSATKGVYIVYLLSRTGDSLYLTFNQGCTDIKNIHGKAGAIKIMRQKAREIAARIDSRGFNTDENINLGQGLTDLGELYQKGTIFYKEYKRGLVPSEQVLREDLSKMMDIYKEYVGEKPKIELSDSTPVLRRDQNVSIKEDIEYIKKYIAAKGFSYNDGLIEDFYLSLKSKPFVILAGTSGTGKTRLVKLFAGAVGAYAKESGGNGRFKLVSVRPDWSDSTDLFGHTDLNGNYIAGAIIDFVKEAKENRDYPYFLCLDEMNLSRVEYYLSDFLSLIETRTNVNGEIKTYKLTLDKAAEKDYPDLYIPENLYVIGTVNMDETTFPFSKKVLDRANTIEFSYVDLIPSFSSDAEAAAPLNKGNDFFKSQYLVLGTDVKSEQQELARRVSVDLQSINKVLQQANAHVGYRVRDEIVFYMLNNDTAKLLDYDTAFDYEIMQKILPRIQGSSEGIKNMMCELFKMFAGDYSGFSQSYIWKQMDDYINKKSCKYTNSAKKLCYMMRRFEEDGFTSYWL
ncbi:MrcB family domain-containing protein [Butyrivibrio fibrisolvens]|uniref:MrcB family domain-containing protein n=1 Tax=Butyrivibrio fibrisolvens TaxID=831 RepID=UPI000414645B|nr:DUF3578 domain-containing protein [Butyrivibrio fibrisolvens]